MTQSSTRPSVSGRQLRKVPSNKSSKTVLWICLAVVAVAVAGVLAYIFTRPAVQHFPDQGGGQSNHLQSPSQPLPVPYNSNPPTSGWHWGGGAADPGIKDTMIEDTITVHSLEHGFVIIHYRADLDKATIDKLKALTVDLQQKNPCIILEPRPVDQLDVPIATTAWTYLLKLPGYDEKALRDFFHDHVGHGFEPVCPVGT